MITIDQLLESVDLDFEPRWVTKNNGGCVYFWENKPKQVDGWYWEADGECNHFSISIKLSEFDGKDWTECIYEVPRKTTGKIERFVIENDRCGNVEWWDVVKKINELVEAVNKHADIIQQIGDWGARKGECLWCEKLTSVNLGE